MAVNGEQQRRPSQVGRLVAFGQRQVDRVVAPPTRQRAYDAAASFAAERPILSAFIASQLLFSSLPLVLFASFALSTSAFALFAAAVFASFWVGVAVLLLVPALCLTTGLAVLVWAWAAATFLVARWVYYKLPVSARGDVAVKMPGGKQVVFQKKGEGMNGDGARDNGTKVGNGTDGNAGIGFDNVDAREDEADEVVTEIKD